MTHYLIEFRFFGTAKYEFKRLIREVNRIFRVRSHRPVPHISLAGPFHTRDEKRLISDFEELCAKQPIMTFNVKGFGTFEENRVVFVNVKPNKNLDTFRWELSKTLRDYCNLRPHDYDREFSFHSTIAMKLGQDKFDRVKKYIETKPEPEFTHCVMRVALIKNSRILREHDFFLMRSLGRREAKSRSVLSESYNRLEKYLKENKMTGINIPAPASIEEATICDVKEGTLGKILNKFKKRQIFFIGDLHLDHTNIIGYCNRPFKSKHEMNNFIVNNWNKTVRRNDVVYFLGDLVFGRGCRPPDYWLPKLRGNIVFIRGGHDEKLQRMLDKCGIRWHDKLILNHESQRFLLVHDPKDVPSDWKGWVIHGHVHNNKPEYPLVDKKNKTINVSAELLEYKPILLEELLSKLI